MLVKHKFKDLTWIDLESPTFDEVEKVAEEFNVHPLIESEMMKPSERARVDPYPNFLYMILHFPKYATNREKESVQEVDFILGKKFLITAHYESINAIYDFSKVFETNTILNRYEDIDNAGIIFYLILKALYEEVEREMEAMGRVLRDVEKKIFAGEESKMVGVLSGLNKTLIDFKQPIRIHREILNSLARIDGEFFSIKLKHYFQAVTGDYERAWNKFESNKETLTDLRETNDSLFSAKINTTIKNLTVLSFMTFPLTLMTGIFGMNTKADPIIGLDNDFWIVMGLMLISSLITILLFRWKRWI